jgi:Zn-dependent protease/predicted transcriptional regulator
MGRGAGLKIAKIFGIPIYLHSSWFVIFILYTLMLTTRSAMVSPDWTRAQQWTMALATSVLFFGSVLFHELAHSVVALHYRIPVTSITLFVFGGVARIARDPARAIEEFLIAAAGPLSSYVLWGGFGLVALATPSGSILHESSSWLSWINFLLATFNLVPGFPLDGGRILRSIVWGVTGSFTRSTRAAARSGEAIAYLMIALGLAAAVFGRRSGGILEGFWLAFIGWFLLNMAKQSYAQAATQEALQGLTVSDLMAAETPTVARDLSLQEYSEEVARSKSRAHLVVADGHLAGLMTLEALRAVPQAEWAGTSVQAAMLSRERVHWAKPEETAQSLMERMRQEQLQEIAVVSDDHVLGLVTLESVAQAMQIRADLGRAAGR